MRQECIICVTWLIHVCAMTRSHVWHDTIIYVTWHIHMCDMTHSYVWHDSFMCVPWLIHMCDMTLSYMWHDSTSLITRNMTQLLLILSCHIYHTRSFVFVGLHIHVYTATHYTSTHTATHYTLDSRSFSRDIWKSDVHDNIIEKWFKLRMLMNINEHQFITLEWGRV